MKLEVTFENGVTNYEFVGDDETVISDVKPMLESVISGLVKKMVDITDIEDNTERKALIKSILHNVEKTCTDKSRDEVTNTSGNNSSKDYGIKFTINISCQGPPEITFYEDVEPTYFMKCVAEVMAQMAIAYKKDMAPTGFEKVESAVSGVMCKSVDDYMIMLLTNAGKYMVRKYVDFTMGPTTTVEDSHGGIIFN